MNRFGVKKFMETVKIGDVLVINATDNIRYDGEVISIDNEYVVISEYVGAIDSDLTFAVKYSDIWFYAVA